MVDRGRRRNKENSAGGSRNHIRVEMPEVYRNGVKGVI